jgi:TolA-binding protein
MLDVKESPDAPNPTAAALARKRRIELRSLQRGSDISDDQSTLSSESSQSKRARIEEEILVDPVTLKPKPSITGIKKQSRYDPGVKMTRDELREWRKEARRVRNRQSAAESRSRNRDQITELESEVDVLNSKYSAALQRIVELEAAAAVNDSFTPINLRQDMQPIAGVGPAPSSPLFTFTKTVSPPLSPITSFSLTHESHHEEVNKKYHHIMEMISRPIA